MKYYFKKFFQQIKYFIFKSRHNKIKYAVYYPFLKIIFYRVLEYRFTLSKWKKSKKNQQKIVLKLQNDDKSIFFQKKKKVLKLNPTFLVLPDKNRKNPTLKLRSIPLIFLFGNCTNNISPRI